MPVIRSHRDLLVWQRGMDLEVEIYRVTAKLPNSELYGLTSQMRRASVSIPSNIAEGYGRQTSGEYAHHLRISRGSLLELETQLLLCQRLDFLTAETILPLLNETEQQNRMLCALISKISPN